MKFFTLLINLILGLVLSAQPTIKEILDSPFASNLTVSRGGKTLAWVDNIAGERNIFIATGEQFASVYKLTEYVGDLGISISNLEFTPDGFSLVYVRGNTKNRQGESANPGLLDEDTDQAIFIHSLNKSKSYISYISDQRILDAKNNCLFTSDFSEIKNSNHFFSNKEEELKIAINAYVKKSTELI